MTKYWWIYVFLLLKEEYVWTLNKFMSNKVWTDRTEISEKLFVWKSIAFFLSFKLFSFNRSCGKCVTKNLGLAFCLVFVYFFPHKMQNFLEIWTGWNGISKKKKTDHLYEKLCLWDLIIWNVTVVYTYSVWMLVLGWRHLTVTNLYVNIACCYL